MKHLKFIVELDATDDLGPSTEEIRESIKDNLETTDAVEVGIRNISVKEVTE